MKTRRVAKKRYRAKSGASHARYAADAAQLERLKNSSRKSVYSRSNLPSISLQFEVKPPPSKNDQNAPKEASSRFEAAYTLFRQRHPNRVPITGRQIPPTDCSPLEYVEWAIWKARERWSDVTWDNWFLGFYENLVRSESLKEVCQDQCQSTDAAYALLGLLLWDTDRSEMIKPTCEHIDEGGGHNICQEQEALWAMSDADARQLLKIQEFVKGLTFDYTLEVNEAATPAVEQNRHHRKTLTEIIDGFMTGLAEETKRKAQVYYGTPKRSPGRSEVGVASPDMFCALVSHFVKEAYRGEDHIGPTILIIKDFAPGLLKDNHAEPMKEANAFVQRLETFRKKNGAIKEFNSLVALYKTDRSFPSIMKTFQPD
ncbi:hypothetical protein YTPLAS72_25710 [Nitrospira sp.]|nr:hypothetical protein YTPLAS72_25710 [Nitrospira sp.]